MPLLPRSDGYYRSTFRSYRNISIIIGVFRHLSGFTSHIVHSCYYMCVQNFIGGFQLVVQNFDPSLDLDPSQKCRWAVPKSLNTAKNPSRTSTLASMTKDSRPQRTSTNSRTFEILGSTEFDLKLSMVVLLPQDDIWNLFFRNAILQYVKSS